MEEGEVKDGHNKLWPYKKERTAVRHYPSSTNVEEGETKRAANTFEALQ
jgi:hypothetical protein